MLLSNLWSKKKSKRNLKVFVQLSKNENTTYNLQVELRTKFLALNVHISTFWSACNKEL